MSEIYTTNTASLKATLGNICKLNAKTIDAKKIRINGEDIEDKLGFQNPEDLKKLCKRMELPEGSNFILYTDNGTPVYISFADKIVDGYYMFAVREKMRSFPFDLPKLENGNMMFAQCTNLTSFGGTLPSLISGNRMFSNCKLDSQSVERILTSIPNHTDGDDHSLTMRIHPDATTKFNEITGNSSTVSARPMSVSFKGWSILVNTF